MKRLKNTIIFTAVFLLIAGVAAVCMQEPAYAAAKPAKVVVTSAKSVDYNAIKITWKKAANAKKYQVYRSASRNGIYKKIATTSKLYFKNTGLKTGKQYFYKVRAVSGTKSGQFSNKWSATPRLKQVTFKGYTSTKTSITLNYNAVNGADGYQIYRASAKNGEYKCIASTAECKYKDQGLAGGKNYFYKVRAFRDVDGSRKLGKFSVIKKYHTQYTYELYYLNDYVNQKVYTYPWSKHFHDGQRGTAVLLYVKTNDPVAWAINFSTENNCLSSAGAAIGYDDIDKALIGGSDYKVPGGYVYSMTFSKAGQQQVDVVRIKDQYLSEGDSAAYEKNKVRTIGTIDLRVYAYGTAYNNWIKNIVAQLTTDDMTPVEKMDAICAYFYREESEFTYNPTVDLPNGDWTTVNLGVGQKTASQPFWISKYWNSWVSPSVLEDIAAYVGGFSSITNMYYQYELGSPKWIEKHWYCRCKYEGKFYFFGACPMGDTCRLDKVEAPDFTDTSWMYKVE